MKCTGLLFLIVLPPPPFSEIDILSYLILLHVLCIIVHDPIIYFISYALLPSHVFSEIKTSYLIFSLTTLHHCAIR